MPRSFARRWPRPAIRPSSWKSCGPEYGEGSNTKDVTATLRQCAASSRVVFLPSSNYNEAFGGDPAPGIVKQLTIRYRIDGRPGEVSLGENATVVLPMPK